MENQINISYQKTKIGEMIFGSLGHKICILDFRYRKLRNALNEKIKKNLGKEFVENESGVIKIAKQQLEGYLEGKRKIFDLPLLLVGTDFQKQVWRELLKIKYGAVISYSNLAKKIENEKAVRAVASANGANSIGIVIPCHRVISSNGDLGGYGGGISVKKKLLQLEGVILKERNTLFAEDRKAEN